MKKIAISALILMSFFKVFSQIEVGHYTDSQGLPIEGYFDELEYANNSGITCTITSNEYEKGYYFDKSGIKFIGWLKLDSKDFSFKEVERSQPKRLTADDVETFVIAKDSFFATSNFRIEGLYFDKTVKADKPRFVKHVCSFDENNFAIYFEFSQGGITSNYIYKKKGQEFWVNIPESSDKSEFKEFWGKKFASYASIRAALTSRNFKGLETLCLIKRAEYEYKLTMKQPIYFDRWWNELQNSDPDGFTAEIDDVKDTIFTISYFQSGVRIAQIQYSQFSPDFKNGYSRWYYPDGTLRKEGIWEDNKLKSSTSFFTNAQKHYNYNVVQS